MKTKSIMIVLSLFLLSFSAILSADDAANDNSAKITIENVDNVSMKDEATKYEPSPGFEKVPVRTIYGPIGILFKAIEITLDKLYIICECKW